MLCLNIFRLKVLKKCCHISNECSRICLIAKIKSFVQKKTGNLEPKIPDLGVLGSNLENILSYLKSAPSNYCVLLQSLAQK